MQTEHRTWLQGAHFNSPYFVGNISSSVTSFWTKLMTKSTYWGAVHLIFLPFSSCQKKILKDRKFPLGKKRLVHCDSTFLSMKYLTHVAFHYRYKETLTLHRKLILAFFHFGWCSRKHWLTRQNNAATQTSHGIPGVNIFVRINPFKVSIFFFFLPQGRRHITLFSLPS